jgi:hypothetical protein
VEAVEADFTRKCAAKMLSDTRMEKQGNARGRDRDREREREREIITGVQGKLAIRQKLERL